MTLDGSQRLTLMPNALMRLLPLQLLRRPLPAFVVCPRVAPHMKLLEIDCARAEIREALLGHLDDVVGGEDVGDRRVGAPGPFQVFRRNLRGGVQLPARVPLQRLAEQLLAASHAVGVRGIEEVAPELDRAIERSSRLLIVRAGPPAHAPHAVADFGDLPARPAESAILHECILDLKLNFGLPTSE